MIKFIFALILLFVCVSYAEQKFDFFKNFQGDWTFNVSHSSLDNFDKIGLELQKNLFHLGYSLSFKKKKWMTIKSLL